VPFSPTDTIVAIATAPVRAGIGVVRMSGPGARGVARAILTAGHDLEPRHATLTGVFAAGTPALSERAPDSRVEGRTSPRRIDEVVATFFPAPHSYTAEDVVEISAHGSPALLREIVRAAIAAGARLAEPGEFTLRAFLNGRLDLVQAEAVADLVDAATPLQARVAFDQLEGTLTRAIGALDRDLFDLAARLEASVDFPEEGYHFVAPGEAAAALARVRDGIDALLATSASGRVIREGRHIAILGKPNVGKSSLFNRLVGTDRAIVASGPGTTRDMLHESIDLDGIRLALVDTAGIRVSEDEVEREGVVRARGAASVADLVILVLDQSRPLDEVDRALLRETASAPRLVVVNKIDLPHAWNQQSVGPPDERQEALSDSQKLVPGEAVGTSSDGPSNQADNRQYAKRAEWAEALVGWRSGAPRSADGTLEARFAGLRERDRTKRSQPAESVLSVSVRTGEGIDALRAAMRDALEVEEPRRDAPMVTNVRHETLLRQAREAIVRALANMAQAGPLAVPGTGESASEELVLADIADARRAFEEVTGKRTTDDLLRRIFERFCIGK
jgi:tRNA modification GTPase